MTPLHNFLPACEIQCCVTLTKHETLTSNVWTVDGVFGLYLQVYASGIVLDVVGIQVSKQSYKVTSSRINRLRPGTLKCSMQDRRNVHGICFTVHLQGFFCFVFSCYSSILGDTKLVIFVRLFTLGNLFRCENPTNIIFVFQDWDRGENEVTCIL